MGLGGWVLNDSRGVLIEVEGERRALEALLERLRTEAPPLAIVERISEETMAATGEIGFRITESEEGGEAGGRRLTRTSRPATTAWRSCWTPATAATATRSPTAPTAAHGSRSSAASPTTAP